MSKLRTVAWAIGRIAARGAGNSRTISAGYTAAKKAGRTFLGIGHLLWLEITGVFFIVFGLGFIARLPRAYNNYLLHREPLFNVGVLVFVALAFFWFGVTAFARARRRQQQLRNR
jgi:hypothetical protein